MDLFLARHGETVSNAVGRALGGGGDSPLTANGVRQAEEMGKLLAGITFDTVYSSPLGRAVDTVRIAFQGNVQPILDERLLEIGLGDMEGLTWKEIVRQYPQSSTFMADPAAYVPPPNGEPLQEMIARIDDFLCDLAEKDYRRVLIQTHGYVLRVFYACMTDHTVAAIGRSPGYGNCEVVSYCVKKQLYVRSSGLSEKQE